MFKKLYLLNLITIMNLFSAACSNDTNDTLFALSMQFSPEPIKALAIRLANHSMPLDEGCDRALLVGEAGTGKSTLAQALGYSSKSRVHQINSTELNGDKYIRSGQVAMNTHLVPIIDMAKNERQVVIIDEFDRLIMADEREEDSKNRVAHFWLILDKMLATRNIFFIGTCNKTEDFPTPLENRLPKNCWYHIGLASIELRTAALKYIFNIQTDDATYDATIDHTAKDADGLSVRSLTIAAKQALAIAIGRGAERPSIDELLSTVHGVRPEKNNAGFVVRIGKFLKDNRDTITVVTSLASLGLGVYQHHQSIKRQEQMQLQQQQFQNETITRNENFTRQMQEDLQAANEQVRNNTQQWQEKYAKEERKRTNNFQLKLLRLNHNNTLELTARQENLQIKLHSESLKNAKDAANWQTWTWLGSTILNAGINYTINCLGGGKGQTSTPASSSDN